MTTLPGLEETLPPVPQGSLLVLEGSAGEPASRLGRAFAAAAARAGRKVRYATTRDPGAVLRAWREDGVDVAAADEDPGDVDDVVVDSYAVLACEDTVRGHERRLRALRRPRGVAVLVVEPEMLPPAALSVVRHHADGIVRFHAREEADGAAAYLRAPVWPDGVARTRNVYYGLDGGRILVDARRRVV